MIKFIEKYENSYIGVTGPNNYMVIFIIKWESYPHAYCFLSKSCGYLDLK